MKHLLFLIILGLSSWSFSQAPEGINYQMVVRNFSNTLITNSPMAIRIQIRQTSATGTIVYSERHPVTTSAQGLVNLVIGGGTVLSGTFSTISWANGPYFACFAIDFSGLSGTNYQDYGSQQLVSVPYALYAKTSGAILNQWQYGTGVPASSSGVTGNYYYDTANGNIYYKQNGTTWILAGNIMGPTGATGQQGTAGPTGTQGPQGIQGVTGPQGPIGLTGPQGPAGANGTAVLNGTTAPISAMGLNGDFYINTTTNILYGPKIGGSWPVGTSLVGPTGPQGSIGLTGATGAAGPQGIQGATGPQGPIGLTGPQGPTGANGVNGTAVLNGTTAPTSSMGVNGDFYINTATNLLYGPKTSGTWPAGVSMVGPIGPQGVQGPVGATGSTGPQGPIGLTGATGPQGIQGITGPQGPIGLTGPQGPAGANGSNGTAVLNGTTPPTMAIGVNGDFYINSSTNILYGPKAGGAWPTGISLVGPNGATGQQGPTGLTGAVGPQGIQGLPGPQGPAGIPGNTYTDTTFTSNGDVYIDCSIYNRILWNATFTANRTLRCTNLTPGKQVIIYVKNNNGVGGININWQASTTTTNFISFPLAGYGSTPSAPVWDKSLAYDGISCIVIANIGGVFIGSN